MSASGFNISLLEQFNPLGIYEGFQTYGDLYIDLAAPSYLRFNRTPAEPQCLPQGLCVRGNVTIEAVRSQAEIEGPAYIHPFYDIILPEGLEVFGNAILHYGQLQRGTHIHGSLDLSGNRNMSALPRDLKVDGHLDVTGSGIDFIPWEVAQYIYENGGRITGIAERLIEQAPKEIIGPKANTQSGTTGPDLTGQTYFDFF